MKRCVAVGAACLGILAVLSARGDETADEQKALEAIRKAGGIVQVDEADPARPAVRVDLAGDKVSDADLAPLEALTHLRRLNLDGAHITDAGLAHLQRLTKLQKLYLTDTPITDAGLARLKKLDGLRELYLLGDKPEGDKGSEFEEKVLDLQKAQPQVKVVR